MGGAPPAPEGGLSGRVSRLSGVRRHALACLLGILAVAAHPPFFAVPVLLISFPALVWMLQGAARGRTAFAVGWWFGAGFFGAGLYWVSNALLVDAASFAWLIPFALVGLSAGLGLFIGGTTWLAWRLAPGPASLPAALAVSWAALEMVRGVIFTGFPWNPMGQVWLAVPEVVQTASIVGVFGLSLATVWIAAAPAAFARGRGAGLSASAVAAVIVVAGFAFGAVRLPAGDLATVPDVRLRLVQPNVPQALKWRPEHRERQVAKLIRLSRHGMDDGSVQPPTHVIWPESAVPLFLSTNQTAMRVVARALTPNGILVAGAPRLERVGDAPPRLYNSLHAIDSAGRLVATYDKFHLVPFGEYVPLRDWLPVEKVTPGRTDFSAGPGPVTLEIPGAPAASPLICYEVIFPGSVVASDAARPGWLLNLTNDGWFGISIGPHQHFASARMRAVEEGLPLVRVANTGISGVIDPYGRVLGRVGLGDEGILDSGLPVAVEETVFSRLGQFAPIFCLFLAISWTLLSSRGYIKALNNNPK